jgi:D-sedoheptulose 7-phosphate isomerase
LNNIDKFFSRDVEIFAKAYFDYLKQVMDKVDLSEIRNLVEILMEAGDNGSTIFFIGNGGSAATASHFANDIAFGTNEYKLPFKALSLTDNTPVLTALGNDYGYDEIFIRQLKIYGNSNDVLVGISASGKSKNIVDAFKYASEAGIKTIAITGFDGGVMKKIADNNVHVPTDLKEYGPAEDLHMILDHLIGNYLMRSIRNE